MTKPMNFPNRKNRRRIGALERLKNVHNPSKQKRIQKEIAVLENRIVTEKQARNIRTKKKR